MTPTAKLSPGVTATGDIYANATPTKRKKIYGFKLTAATAGACAAVFRTGGASGTVVWTLACPASGSVLEPPPGRSIEVAAGLHVTITGTTPVGAYVLVDGGAQT